MSLVDSFPRWFVAGVGVALLAGLGEANALAGGHFHYHGHGVATTGVAIVPVSSGFQAVGVSSPALMATVAAPAQWQFVNSTQFQSAAPTFQAFTPNASTFLVAVPQGQASASGLQVGQQPVLSQGQLLFQQQLLQQLESSGFLKNLKDRLAQRLNDLRAQQGGILPSKDQIVKFLLNEAFAFLKDTPFGPFLAFLQPAIERLIDNVIQEQPPVPVPPVIPGGTTPGAVRRYLITVQEVSADGTIPPLDPNSKPDPKVKPTPNNLPPTGTRDIKCDPESPLETFAPYTNP